jgi:hypothetical protein
MNQVPPGQEPSQDIDEYYRRASALDPSRPSESVRRAVLERAAQLAARRSRWRPAVVGWLAAAGLAGLLVTPYFLESVPSPDVSAETSRSYTQVDEARPAAQSPAPARAQAEVSNMAGAPPSAAAPAAATQLAARSMDSAARSMAPAARPVDPTAALRRAAQIGDLAGLQSLLANAHDINARDESGRTALMLATVHGEVRAVDVLLAHGADPNAADAQGMTPLQVAVAADQAAIIASLRRAGAR